MVKIGQLNTLTIIDFDNSGAFFDGGDTGEGDVLLPRSELPENCEIGQKYEVFVYLDSEDLLTATFKRPFAMVGEAAVLKVVSLERVGAFLDWGLPKDLLLPFAEQTGDLRMGEEVVVYLYLDKSERISASMRLQRHVSKIPGNYAIGQPVDLLIVSKTDLGFKALVDGRHFGVLYADEVFQTLKQAQRIQGYIKLVRPDGKLDLSLTRTGSKAALDDIAPLIMERLHENDGFLAINDKSPAEVIHSQFGVSRKKFKIALGGLYKKRLIKIEADGIRLTPLTSGTKT
jgi:predicted RNA-binding protein (virulence factor B family)